MCAGFNQSRVKKCGGLDTLLQLLRRYERESRDDFAHLQTAVALVNVINACITDNGRHRGGMRNTVKWVESQKIDYIHGWMDSS